MTREEILDELMELRAKSWEMKVGEIPEENKQVFREAGNLYNKTKDEDVILAMIGACPDCITFGGIPFKTKLNKEFRQKAYLVNPNVLKPGKITIEELQDLKENLPKFKDVIDKFYDNLKENDLDEFIQNDIEIKKEEQIYQENKKRFSSKVEVYNPKYDVKSAEDLYK